MFRKSFILTFFVGALLVFGPAAAFAQTAPVNGTVNLDKGAGVVEPVAGALVEVYRTDIKQSLPAAKTNKKGEFNFAGFMFGGSYALSVSAPGCAPTIYPGVKAGQEKLVITMSPGDGKKWTEAEVRKAVADGAKTGGDGTAGPSEDDKKAQAEVARKNAEIDAKNKKIQEGDSLVRKSNEEGQIALKADNYDLAIAKFTEGITAVPDYVGSTPILLSGKMLALKGKAFKIYKEGAPSTDLAVKRAKFDEANKSYDEALAAFQEAIAIIKKAEPSTDPVEMKRRETLKTELHAAATEIHRLKAVPGVDTTKTADAEIVINDYVALELDPVRKLAAQTTLGDIMRLTGDFEKAVAAYRKVMEMKPDHPEAMGSLGLTLFAQGAAASPEDKEKMQEGLNFMQKYTELSPVAPTDSQQVKDLKVSIKDAVDYLKSQKMTPQKVAAPKKRT